MNWTWQVPNVSLFFVSQLWPKNVFNSRRPRDISRNHQLLCAHRHVPLLLHNEHLATVQEQHLVEEIRHSAADGKSCYHAVYPAEKNSMTALIANLLE
jgi:hypothetical protein